MYKPHFSLLLLLFTGLFARGQQPVRLIDDSTLQGGQSYFWHQDTIYLLDGLVFLEAGGSLRIEAGTVIKGKAQPSTGASSALVISQGATIEAIGTPRRPILFTAEQDDTNNPSDMAPDSRGLWGGLVLLGYGKTNAAGSPNALEGLPAPDNRALFGGMDDEDNSGALSYVSIRHAGMGLAGLTLAGVGSGAFLNHLEVFSAQGDGIRLWGGTAALKYISVAFCGEDQIDWDYGWRGKGLYWLSVQAEDTAGYAINGKGGTDISLLSRPEIFHTTLIGSGQEAPALNPTAIYLHQRSGGILANSIFVDFPNYGIEVEDLPGGGDAHEQLQQGNIQLLSNYWQFIGARTRLEAGPEGILQVTPGADDPAAALLATHLQGNGNYILQDSLFYSISRTANESLYPGRIDCMSEKAFGLASYPPDPFFLASLASVPERNARGAFFENLPGWWWVDSWTALEEYDILPSCQFSFRPQDEFGFLNETDTLMLDCSQTDSLWQAILTSFNDIGVRECPGSCNWVDPNKLGLSTDRRERRKRRPGGNALRENGPPSCYLEEWIWTSYLLDNETYNILDTFRTSKLILIEDREPPEIQLAGSTTPNGPTPFDVVLSDCDTAWISSFTADTIPGLIIDTVAYRWIATDYCGNLDSFTLFYPLGQPAQDWYADRDGDGFGDPGRRIASSIPLPSYVLDNTDCDDSDPLANPSATENPGNAVDDDCDGAGGYNYCNEALEIAADGSQHPIYFMQATPSADAPPFSCQEEYIYADVWLKLTVPSSGNLRLNISQGFFGLHAYLFELYTGDCQSLTSLGCYSKNEFEFYPAGLPQGEAVFIRIGSIVPLALSSETTVTASEYSLPVNDECSGAISLPVGTDSCITTFFPLDYANFSPAGPNGHCFSSSLDASGDVWFAAIVPPSGKLRISGSGWTGLALYAGDCAGELLGCYTIHGAKDLAGLPAGETILLKLFFTSFSGIDICLQDLEGISSPSNSPCAGAILLESDSCYQNLFTFINAISSPGPAVSCTDARTLSGLWYKTVVPSSGSLVVEVSTLSGSSSPPYIQLYLGTACETLVPLACGLSLAKVVSLPPGTDIYIRLLGVTGSEEPYNLCLNGFPYPPGNDNCTDALPIPLSTACEAVAYYNFGAYLSPGLEIFSCTFDNNESSDVWFSAIAPPSGELFIESNTTSGNPIGNSIQIQAFRGPCGQGVLLDCSTFGFLQLSGLMPGETVFIRVSAYDSNFAPGQGSFAFCAYDTTGSFLQAGAISGAVLTENGDALEGAVLSLASDNQPIGSTLTNSSGQYTLSNLSAGAPYLLTPSYNGSLTEGVTNLDLIAILRHYLGIRLLNSPYKLIAADLNEDQSINIDDITLLNQANLGILNQFPNGRSWRFVDAAYSFPAPGNPWQEPWPETATFDSLSAGSSSKSFIAIATQNKFHVRIVI